MVKTLFPLLALIFVVGVVTTVWGDSAPPGDGQTLDGNLKAGMQTDPDTLAREEEAISIDGLSVAQMKEIREKSEKFTFQAEVDRMMKLIINSLYRNKEIFLRELISNASDALDKLRFISLTDASALAATNELAIRIKANKEDKTLHIIDTGIGMTKEEMIKNLGTIAKSGTSEFMAKLAQSQSSAESSELIGQFGVGFYSSFLVADRVTVISKHNDDEQYIWESDASSFSLIKDPRGNTLKRGTEVILHLKDDTSDYLEQETLKTLAMKYSQFINFPIYLWTTTKEMVDEEKPAEATPGEKTEDAEKKDDDATVEEEKEKPAGEAKKVEKTVTKWELLNETKPIWTRKSAEIKEEEYNAFYKSFSKDYEDPLTKIHFTAEGEVTFKSILFIPKKAPHDMFRTMNSAIENIKLYVRRVFITDNFQDMMPSYLNFIKGVVDSDDLPLNVSRETLQQSKLLKVIKKKLVRKALDMIKKLSDKDADAFWKEFSTNIKLGVVEDNSNRTRLAKLLRFWSSQTDDTMTTLTSYVSRMKERQKAIFFIAGESKDVLRKSPLVERVLKKGYEVLFMIDPIDEYAINALPDFEGKKLQNLAKEGLELSEDSAKAKERKEALTKEYQPLIDWLAKDALTELVEKVELSDRLSDSPCALVATQWGNSGNMERIMRAQAYKKSEDPKSAHVHKQKQILEINPRHPLIKELKARVSDDRKSEATTLNMASVLYETAVLRSGYDLRDVASFAQRVEHMMRLGLNVPLDEKAEEEEEILQEAGGDAADAGSAVDDASPEPAVKDDDQDEEEAGDQPKPQKVEL